MCLLVLEHTVRNTWGGGADIMKYEAKEISTRVQENQSIKSNQIKSNQIKSNQIKSNHQSKPEGTSTEILDFIVGEIPSQFIKVNQGIDIVTIITLLCFTLKTVQNKLKNDGGNESCQSS